MPDKKLTDNEIVKALDICSKSTNGCSHSNYSCEDCYLNGQPMCSTVLLQATLDLINRLQAENEALINGQKTLQKYIAEQKAEIERLKSPFIKMYEQFEGKIKAEAYKECIEKVKDIDQCAFDGWIEFPEDKLDNLLKELEGEDNVK